MTSKRSILIASLSTMLFIVLLILLVLGVSKGISLRGRWIERLLVLAYVFVTIYGLVKIKKGHFKKVRNWMWLNLLTPFLGLLVTFIVSPLLSLQIILIAITGMLKSEQFVYENQSYIIKKTMSLSSDSGYELIEKKGVFQEVVQYFNTNLELSNYDVQLQSNSVLLKHKFLDETKQVLFLD